MEYLFKSGQIVRFKNPLPHEDQNMLFLIKEAHYDVEKPRGLIQEFDWDTSLASTFTILLNELEPVFFNSQSLIGTAHTIITEEDNKIQGTVIEVLEEIVNLRLQKTNEGVITNVFLSILEENNQKRFGYLFVPKGFCQIVFPAIKTD